MRGTTQGKRLTGGEQAENSSTAGGVPGCGYHQAVRMGAFKELTADTGVRWGALSLSVPLATPGARMPWSLL